MKTIISFYTILVISFSVGQIIDISKTWVIKCPHQCTCEILKFSNLSIHQWIKSLYQTKSDYLNLLDSEHPLANELLKVVTCTISEDPKKLLFELPNDIQVFTILESGIEDKTIFLEASDMQRFTELISLDIQGMERKHLPKKNSFLNKPKKKGIILSSDILVPLGMTLLYLNLERVTLTRSILNDKNKANLIIKPEKQVLNQENITESTNNSAHQLILLTQKYSDNDQDEEILPDNIYKQEIDSYQNSLGLFMGLTVLTHLRVYNCALKDISWQMFDGLDSLEYLSFQKNNLKFIPKFCFYGTPNLRLLSLADNEILTLSSIDLAGLLHLEHLDMSKNNLTFMTELSFPPFPSLLFADFRGNPLNSIFPSTFEIMNQTKKLQLGGSSAKLKLQKHSFVGLKNLEILHLHNLEIPVLERYILLGMPFLTELKLRGNITIVDFDAFTDLKSLIKLDIKSCKISQISMDAFYGLKNLRMIDLSYNNIKFIPSGLFLIEQQPNLEEIYLNNNKLTKLPFDFFKNLRLSSRQYQIKHIRLDNNPWHCTCSMIKWNSNLINEVKKHEPRCSTPKSLKGWGIFYALRKGSLECRWSKYKQKRKV